MSTGYHVYVRCRVIGHCCMWCVHSRATSASAKWCERLFRQHPRMQRIELSLHVSADCIQTIDRLPPDVALVLWRLALLRPTAILEDLKLVLHIISPP